MTFTPDAQCHPSLTERNTMKVRRRSDGAVFERSAPDARDFVSSGQYEYADRAVPSTFEILSGKSQEELEHFCYAIGQSRSAHGDRAHMINAILLPAVEAGILNLSTERES